MGVKVQYLLRYARPLRLSLISRCLPTTYYSSKFPYWAQCGRYIFQTGPDIGRPVLKRALAPHLPLCQGRLWSAAALWRSAGTCGYGHLLSPGALQTAKVKAAVCRVYRVVRLRHKAAADTGRCRSVGPPAVRGRGVRRLVLAAIGEGSCRIPSDDDLIYAV